MPRAPYYDVALAVKAGADVIVLDGMQGGTAATQDVFIEHVGIPILAAIPHAVESLQELGMHRTVQLVVSGGIRTGADVAKALALGADAVSIGVAALIALGDITAYARDLRAAGLDGTMDQLRARAFLDLALGVRSHPPNPRDPGEPAAGQETGTPRAAAALQTAAPTKTPPETAPARTARTRAAGLIPPRAKTPRDPALAKDPRAKDPRAKEPRAARVRLPAWPRGST